MIADLETAVAFAEREREEARLAFTRALRAYTQADIRLLEARLELDEVQAQPTDTKRKARP